MDGVPDVTQPPIPPGGTFVYKFTVTPQMVGTHYYHSHYDDAFQVDKGMYGPLIVDPATSETHYDVDALYVIGSWNLSGQEGNEDAFSLDGKPWPNAPQLNVKLGQTVRIRFINASAIEPHAMHLHGYTFKVVAIDGNPVPQPQAQNTVTLLPGETADISFTANNPGRWMLHCHILDHMMNPGDDVDDMGGLVTFVNVH
jgi:FtsP/CotA-like multicopper oxidase with cupredoxin domain